jgi:DNA repair exonuclease SbcCD ATPase subunit
MKTEFERFRIENGGCIEEADMPLVDQGLVLIRGENEDEGGSNGAGKSTLFELLANHVYGKTTKGPTDNELLNLLEPKNFLTHLQHSRDGKTYFSDVYRKVAKRGTGVEIFEGEHLSEEHKISKKGISAAQKQLAELTGFTWNEFQGKVYLSQKYTHTMLEGTPSEKKDYLSRHFGLHTLDALIAETTKRLNAIPLPDESHIRGLLDHVENELKALGDVPSVQAALEQERESSNKTQKRILSVKLKLQEQAEAARIAEERSAIEKRCKRHGAALEAEALKAKVVHVRRELSAVERKLATLQERAKLEAKLAAAGADSATSSYEEISAEVEKAERLLDKFQSQLPRLEQRAKYEKQLKGLEPIDSSIDDVKAELLARKEKLAELDGSVRLLQSEISKLSKLDDTCPTCMRPISSHEKEELIAERKDRHAKLSGKVSKLQELVEYLATQVETETKRLALISELEDLPEGDADEVRERIASLKVKRRDLAELASNLVKLTALQDRLRELPVVAETAEELSPLKEQYAAAVEDIEECYDWVLRNGEIEYDPYEYQRSKELLISLEQRLQATNNEILRLQDVVSRHELLNRQKSDYESILNKSSREKTRHRALHYVTITLKELKKIGLRESTELLTQVLPVYLKQLYPSGGITLGVSDSGDGINLVFQKGGQSIGLKSISGGQAKRVGLAIIFAFAKMGQRTTNLLIADEPFTHLDKKGRQACYDLLRDLDIGTILVTAHDQDLTSSRKMYDQIWTIRMQNHKSRLYLNG